MDFKEILKAAEGYREQIAAFLRDMIAIPSESTDEKMVVERIRREMETVGFDKIEIDPMGNILGYIGHGKHLLAMDAHIDTVGVGNVKLWNYDPARRIRGRKLPSLAAGPATRRAAWPPWFTPGKS